MSNITDDEQLSSWLDESLSFFKTGPELFFPDKTSVGISLWLQAPSPISEESESSDDGYSTLIEQGSISDTLEIAPDDHQSEASDDSQPSFFLFDFADDEIACVPEWESADGSLAYHSSSASCSNSNRYTLTPTPWFYEPPEESPSPSTVSRSSMDTTSSSCYSAETCSTESIRTLDSAMFLPLDIRVDHMISESLAPLDEQLRCSPTDSFAELCWSSTYDVSSSNRLSQVSIPIRVLDGDDDFQPVPPSPIRFHLLDTIPEDYNYFPESDYDASFYKLTRFYGVPANLAINYSTNSIPSPTKADNSWRDVKKFTSGVWRGKGRS